MAKPSKRTKPVKRAAVSTATRRLKAPHYKTFRLSRKIKHPGAKLPHVLRLLRASWRLIYKNRRLFAGILAIYVVLTFLLVHSVQGGADLADLKGTLQELFRGYGGRLTTGVTLFGILVGSSGSGDTASAGLYQSILLIVFSLAIIWTLRQLLAGNKVKISQVFYDSMYPLIPFLLVLLVIGVQLLPLIIGSSVYSLVVSNAIAVTALEKFLWALMCFMLAILSLYMVSSSVFALYIVTLPDMTPLRALRSARELVRHRRWIVMRKILFLPLALVILTGFVVIPFILTVTTLAPWIFFLCAALAVAMVHAYMYTLYRELL